MQQSLDFLLYELIGKHVEVSKSSCKDLQGLKGIILLETKNTFLVENEKKEKKTIPKKGNVFFFPEFKAHVNGEMLDMRPEERTKKLHKKLVL